MSDSESAYDPESMIDHDMRPLDDEGCEIRSDDESPTESDLAFIDDDDSMEFSLGVQNERFEISTANILDQARRPRTAIPLVDDIQHDDDNDSDYEPMSETSDTDDDENASYCIDTEEY